MPFYWLGDLGYFQIAAFVGFAALCLRGPRGATPAALTAVLLLLGSPLFLWEVVVRSELTANMVLVAWFLAWVERRSPGTDEAPPADPPDAGGGLDPGAGLAAGLLLSTRGIVALVDALVFTAVFRRRHGAGARFVAVAALAFLATLVPFLVWDAPRFLANGPFAIQLSYAPLPVVAGAHDWRAVHSRIALLLFAVVAVPFALALETEGVAGVFSRDRFDISYFAFAHSFALLALARPPETRPLQAPAGRGGRTR